MCYTRLRTPPAAYHGPVRQSRKVWLAESFHQSNKTPAQGGISRATLCRKGTLHWAEMRTGPDNQAADYDKEYPHVQDTAFSWHLFTMSHDFEMRVGGRLSNSHLTIPS